METDKTPAKQADVVADDDTVEGDAATPSVPAEAGEMPREINGPKGPEPTRYGDWEQKGRCSDF